MILGGVPHAIYHLHQAAALVAVLHKHATGLVGNLEKLPVQVGVVDLVSSIIAHLYQAIGFVGVLHAHTVGVLPSQ